MRCEVRAICVENIETMRGSVSLLSIAIIVSGLEGCHHKHNNNKLGPLSNNNNNNNNNIRNNLNNIGRRRRRQTFNNVLGGNSNLPNTGLRSQAVSNTNPGLNNNRPGSEQNSPLQPWSKLYWPRW